MFRLSVTISLLLAINSAQGFILQFVGPAVCEDKDPDCKYYDSDLCTGYKDWAQVNCAVYCNFCTPVKTNPPPDCNDRLADCADYGDICNNPSFTKWVDINCRATCGVAGCRKKTPPPTAAPTCKDLRSDCNEYGPNACTDPIYKPWREKNCRAWCRVDGCTRPTAAPTNPPACVDLISDCASYGDICTNPRYIPWAKQNCRKYCEFNGCKRDTPAPTPPTPRPACVDMRSDCFLYDLSVCNNPEYAGWVGDNCRKYCSKC